jgi:aspartyl-tRNA(Asn)/glutamyl-tRNA(Gln) amidotransferase subunit A
MAGEAAAALEAAPLRGLRLGIAQGFPLQGLDPAVTAAWSHALDRLGKAGVRLSEETIPLLDQMVQVNARGGFAPAEAFAIHRERLKRRGADVDPNVRARIERGGGMSAADYIEMAQERNALIAAMDARLAGLDALVMPTTPIVAPKMAEVATPDAFAPSNMLLLRNTSTVNFFDLCAISLPLPRDGGLPTGLMLVARNGHDQHLFRIAAAVEQLLTD